MPFGTAQESEATPREVFVSNSAVGSCGAVRTQFFIDQTLHAFDVRTIDRGVYPLSIGISW